MEYIIISLLETALQKENMYWSNELGWTTKKYADVFSETEKQTMNLPIGGIWVTKNNP